MKKVLIIRGSSISPDPRVEKIAYSLYRNGFNVEILGWDREKKHPINERRNSYSIHRFPFRSSYGNIRTVFKMMFWWIYELLFILRNKSDILHVCGFDSLVPIPFVRIFSKKKIVYDIFDFYADILPLSIPARIRKVVAVIERYLLNFTDSIIIVDDIRREEIGKVTVPVEIIMNSPLDLIIPNSFNEKWESPLIFYAAQFSYINLRAFQIISKAVAKMSNVTLEFAGWGPATQEIIKIAESLDNVDFVGRLSHLEVMKRSARSNLLIALYDPRVPIHRLASPNKLFEAMAASKPIIMNSEILISKIILQEQCGLVIDFENLAGLRSAINTIITNKKLAEAMGKRGRRAYETKYSWKIMEERLFRVYNNLINS